MSYSASRGVNRGFGYRGVRRPVAPPAPEPVEPAAEESYDPGEATVDEVKAHVAEHPGSAAEVLAAERADKNRVTLVEWLEEFIEEAE